MNKIQAVRQFWHQARRGDMRVTSKRTCTSAAAIAFIVGIGFGGAMQDAVYRHVYASNFTMTPAVFTHVGDDLCKHFGGLKWFSRIDINHFKFVCRDLAEFPLVELTYMPNENDRPQ